MKELLTILPAGRVKTRLIDLVAYAADAGFYHLVPKAVVQPVDEKEIRSLFHLSHQLAVPLVFRTGGTSLSGQSITDGILVDLSQHWNKMEVLQEGRQVRVQPGITGAMVNARLKQFNRKIGPDPSSIQAAMMGGILSNNASGMCCGVQFNSYHTTKYIRFMLTNGQIFSTENAADHERFVTDCKELAAALVLIKEEILHNEQLHASIREKYITKNTVGYSLNAFIDHTHPLDIFAHLLIGGEGTLAFISEAVLETIPDEPYKATSLLYFPDIYAACQAILPLKNAGAAMVELMDRASLRAVASLPGMDPFVQTLPDSAAALLIEFQEPSTHLLTARVNDFLAATGTLSLLNAPAFTSNAQEREFLWKVRKGLFPSVGAVRASGTTVILEDVAFPLNKLGDAILALQALFKTYAYHNAIIFGHARDGNIHFVVTQSFNTPAEIARYDSFLREVVHLVVNRFNGTLKAEHGTGRNMAPFVETEWGADAYRIMQRIKAAADPLCLLNPGVIINKDKAVHIKDLKQLPAVEAEVDRCIECGYCEPVCPSRNLTLTPRRRIVVRRVLAKMKADEEHAQHKTLLEQYKYDGLETCAVDGLCAGACPVDINTGDLVKRLRRENHADFANSMAYWVARHFLLTEQIARIALKAGILLNRITGKKTMYHITRLLRRIFPSLPLWSHHLLAPPALPSRKNDHTSIVYFPACISRLLGASPIAGKKNIMETFLDVSAKAGIGVKVVENIKGSCCGQIFHSKGFDKAYRFTADKIIDQLWQNSAQGQFPVVTDVSSCAYTLQGLRPALSLINRQKFDQLRIIDTVDYLHDMVMPNCPAPQKKGSIVLHPVCSLKKMGTEKKFGMIAAHFAEQVTIPVQAGCCGMAGDRGFLFPELTASATYFEAQEVRTANYEGYYSSTKTCEIAMTEAVSKNYESILYLVHESLA